jgi:hypothetical protein
MRGGITEIDTKRNDTGPFTTITYEVWDHRDRYKEE